MVLDVSQPTQPVVLSDWSVNNRLHRLAVSPEHAVVSPFTVDLQFFVLEKGVYPVHTAEVVLGGGFADVALAGSYAYAVPHRSGSTSSVFHIIDLSNAKQPTIVGTLTLPSVGLRVRVAGRYAYVAGLILDNNIGRNVGQTIDISNPAQPVVVSEWLVVGIPSSIWTVEPYLYFIDEGSDFIQVLDISNPLQPTTYDLDLSAGGASGGHTYGAVSDGYAYIVSAASGILRVIRLP
jgi:hypothetical protein